MIDFKKLGKLTVGDIANYEEWRRETRKKELIEITKELYGNKVPADCLAQINAELKRIPSIMDEDGRGFDITAAQYLFWKSIQKNEPTVTFEQVGNWLEAEKLEEYSEMLFPTPAEVPSDDEKEKEAKKNDETSQ